MGGRGKIYRIWNQAFGFGSRFTISWLYVLRDVFNISVPQFPHLQYGDNITLLEL